MIGMDRGVIWFSDQQRNQACTRLYVRSKRGEAAIRGAFTVTSWRNVRMSSKSAEILPVASRAVASSSVSLFYAFYVLSSSLYDLLALFYSNSLAAESDPHLAILVTNVLRSSPSTVYPSIMTASVRNGGRRTTFRDVQYLRFFHCVRLKLVAQRRTSVTRRWIFLPVIEKMHSTLMETTIEGSRYPARAKALRVSLRDLLPADA